MTLAAFRHSRSRFWLAAIVLPLLCLRALVPVGFMPAPADGGWVTMQVCTTYGLETRRIQFDAPLEQEADRGTDPERAAHSPCPFALGFNGALPSVSPWLTTFATLTIAPAILYAPVLRAAPEARSQTPRGPPLNSV